MSKPWIKLIIFILSLTSSLTFFPNTSFGSQTIGARLSGKILLQVESKGEAWYVKPNDSKRYYLGKPSDAFAVMRDMGLGISETDKTCGCFFIDEKAGAGNYE